MAMTGMAPNPGISLGQTDPITVESIDRADMDAVGADHFHVLADCVCVSHA
jgi:hypothetical protein